MPEADGAIERVSCAIAVAWLLPLQGLPVWKGWKKRRHMPVEAGGEEAARHVTSLTRSAAPVKSGPQKLGLWLSAGLSALVGDFYDCPAAARRPHRSFALPSLIDFTGASTWVLRLRALDEPFFQGQVPGW